MGRLNLLPFILWFSVTHLPPVKTGQDLHFSNYVLPCQYNDKTIALNVSIDDSFEDLQKQDIFNGVCIALKAFRECRYLRDTYPAQKALGTQLLAKGFLYIHNDPNVETIDCGYTYPYDNKNEIWLTQLAWMTHSCDRVSQILFHETLHLSMMPTHDYSKTGRYLDPIETTVRMCLR